MIYLYVKTHNITGFKYFGKTERDPFVYKGSGKHWKRHIEKHGNDVTTEIVFQSEDPNEISEKGKELSELWNIVESKDWANMRPETGDGGDTSKFIDYQKRTQTFIASGYKHTPEINKKAVARRRESDNYMHMKTENQKRLAKGTHNFTASWTCEHCGSTGKNQINYLRWHGDKCKKGGMKPPNVIQY